MIKTGELENRMEAPKRSESASAEKTRRPTLESEPVPTAQDLAQRIAAAKTLTPEAADRHCFDCWRRGRDAAIRAIEGAGQP